MGAMTVQEAIERLQAHGNRYISLINLLQNPVKEVVEEDGVIFAQVRSDDSRIWTAVAADTPEQLRGVRAQLLNHTRFFAAESWMYPYLAEGREVLWDEPCHTYYLPDHVPFPEQERLPQIPAEHAKTVQRYWTYQDEWTMTYILHSIRRGLSSMKFVEDQPVAWSAIQDDGAMGMMHVLKEYRRHGYAREVSIDLIQKYRDAGRIPFVHILHTNQASIALAKSLGFELLKEICWLEVN